eukprot:scaffold183723_cov17-Tisochrysis_lutea.AAC.2
MSQSHVCIMHLMQLDPEEAAFLQEQLQASNDDGLYAVQGNNVQEQDEGQEDEYSEPSSHDHSSAETTHTVEDEKFAWNLDAPTAWKSASTQQQEGAVAGGQGPGEAHPLADADERSSE